jgi:hypothetical protein
MPTLKYKVQTRCWNCGEIQHTELMKNHALVPAVPDKGEASYYLRNKPKAEQTLVSKQKTVFKRCENCREPDLIPLHLWDATVRRIYGEA